MFQIYDFPDFDQLRTTLPNNGKMYCVPTSFINLIHFMGTHGIPSLLYHEDDPANAKLFSPDPALNYEAITARIKEMATRCGTDPEDGSSGDMVYEGLRSYIYSRAGSAFNIVRYTADEQFPGPLTAIGWLQNGGVVAFCHGKYDEDYVRDGGHCVTLIGISQQWIEPPPPDEDDDLGYNPHIEGWGEEYLETEPPASGHWIFDFRYRDPISKDSKTTQSGFLTKIRRLAREWHCWGTFGDFVNNCYPLWRIGSGRRFVDVYYHVHPQMALTNVITDRNTYLHMVFSNFYRSIIRSEFPNLDIPSSDPNNDAKSDEPFYAYTGPSATPALDIQRFREEFGAADPRSPIWTNPISDLVWMPVIQHAVFTMANCKDVYGYNISNEKTKHIIELPAPPRKVIFGGYKRDLFALLPGQICRVDMKDILAQQAEVKAEVEVPAEAETLAFDEVNQRLIVATPSELHFYDRNLKLSGSTFVPSLRGETRLTVRVSRQSGEVYFMRSGQRAVQKLRLVPDSFRIDSLETIGLAEAESPSTFDLGTVDQIIVSDRERMAEYDATGRQVRDSVWNNFAAGCYLELTQNFHNPVPFKETWLVPGDADDTEIPE
jgi:hypothetical protein